MRVSWVLACLMADMLDPGAGDRLPEPWKGIVARLAALPIEDRLEVLGSELEGIPGVDVDAVLDAIFAIDPRKPAPESPPTNPIPFSPLYKGNGKTDSERLRTISLQEFMSVEDAEIQWCVERLFPVGSVAILAAPGGYGKSWMLIDLAVECARGGRWLGRFPTRRTRVLYIDEESSEQLMRYRLRKMLKGKGIEGDGLDVHFSIGSGFSFNDQDSVDSLRAKLEEFSPGLVIIDSLIRVHRVEENSATEMAKVFAVVKDLVRQSGATFVFADHQRKQGHIAGSLDQLLRGSSEKTAFVDCLLSMQRKDGNLIIEHSKSRFAEAIPSFVVRIEDPEAGATVVIHLGDAAKLKEATKMQEAEEFLATAIPAGEWVLRKDLMAQAKEAKVSPKTITEMLKALVGSGRLERDDRKSASGRGGPAAFYRWRESINPFSISPSLKGEAESDSDTDSQMGLLDA